MARSTRPFVSFAVLALAATGVTACASVEARPRYATRIEDILPSEQSAPDRPAPRRPAPPAQAERPPVEFDDTPPPAETLPPPTPIETTELPPLTDNVAPPPRSQPTPQRPRPEPQRPADPAPVGPPPVVGPPDAAMQYVVQGGDTLSGIGRRFATPVQKLIELNGLSPEGTIRAGQRLLLPASAIDRGVDPYAVGPAPRAVRPAPGVGLEGQRQAARPDPAPPQRESESPPPPPPPPSRVVTAPPPPRPAPPARPVVAPPPSQQAQAPSSGPQSGRGKFIWPVRGEVLSRFGSVSTGIRNDGVNIAAPQGTPVKAAAMGDVVYAGSAVPGFGNLVLIKHADRWVTAYGHLERITVKMRDKVGQGTEIGTVGTSGGVQQPQLHFEIRYASSPTVKAAPVDPTPILP